MPVKVAYQGERGSNSQVAARMLADQIGLAHADYLGLVNSIHVIESLVAGFCDYGVVAVKNSFAGTVKETADALVDAPINVLGELSLSVNHCLFKLPSTPLQFVRYVASHPQALAQTRGTRQQTLPAMEEIPMPDTAVSARYLREGQLGPTVAVVCSQEAGNLYGLELVASGIQDAPDNHTDFVIFTLK